MFLNVFENLKILKCFVSVRDHDTFLQPKMDSTWNRDVAGISTDAYWVWNGGTFNHVGFRFDFAWILGTESMIIMLLAFIPIVHFLSVQETELILQRQHRPQLRRIIWFVLCGAVMVTCFL